MNAKCANAEAHVKKVIPQHFASVPCVALGAVPVAVPGVVAQLGAR